MPNYDVIVAGLGAMGSATLQHLAGRGVRALGIDRFGVAHEHGSSGGDTRLIRKAYFEHPDYVPLLERAWTNWRALEAATGESILFDSGTLYVGPPEGDLIDGSRRSAALHGLPLETLSERELRARYPQFRIPDQHVAVFEPEAGFLLAGRAIRASVESARRRGATVATGTRLLDWQVRGDGVRVRTAHGAYQAAHLVLTLGSWSAAQLVDLGLALTVTRQPLFWTRPPTDPAYALGRLPAWAVELRGRPGLCYGFPQLDPALGVRGGLKLAHHLPGEPVDPDVPMRPADAGEYRRLLQTVGQFLPELRGPWSGAAVCKYTMSRDGHFVLDRHPHHPQVTFACGFSGHGFKFASVLGEALADLALEGRSALPIDFLRRAGRLL